MPPRKTTHTSRKNTSYTKNCTTTNWKTNRTTTKACSPAAQYPCNSPKFRPVKNECQWRMGSYRNIYSQVGGATRTSFSPTTANKWIRYVNAGVRVYKFNNRDFYRYFGANWAARTPTAARSYLKQKYGAGIKDVTRGTNCWLVATTKNVTARPFITYNWK